MTILICGLGSVGRRHLRNLIALGWNDVALMRTGKSTLPDEDLGSLPVERDLASALERWQPSGVIVSNPTALHMEVALPAAEAGCHLLIEKPISDNLDRIDELRAALARGGGSVLVGYQFRFHPGLGAIRELLASEAIGHPLTTRVHWGEYLPDWHPWEDYRRAYSARADLGGGVVLTLCHPFDYLRWLFGEASYVTAEIGSRGDLGIDVEDSADILIGFETGHPANVHLNYNQRPACHWLEIVGTEGTIRWQSEDGDARWWRSAADGWQIVSPPHGFERNSMFLAEMQHFLEVIEGRATPVCGLEDGIRSLEIALASKRSAAEGRRINLPATAGVGRLGARS